MTKSITAMIAKLEAMQATAENRANSENEKTADKYTEVSHYLTNAIDALNAAVEWLDS